MSVRTASVAGVTRGPVGTELAGPRLLVARVIWLSIAVLTGAVGVASFINFFDQDELIEAQGPLALQPGLVAELERLFDVDFIRAAQISVQIAGMVLFVATALLIFWRKSDDWVALLGSITLLAVGGALFAPSDLLVASRPGWEAAVDVLGIFDASPEFWRSLAGASIILFAFLFPDGRFVPGWARQAIIAYGAWVGLWILVPGPVFDVGRWPDSLQLVWSLGIPLAVVASQLFRYIRVSGPATRAQTRLVVISISGAVGTFVLLWGFSPDLSKNIGLGLVIVTERLQAIYDLNLLSLLTIALMLFPLSIGVSVARYRLWDMDLFVNRALVYGALTGVIALALFVGVVLIGQAIQATFGGGIGLAGAVTGILMVALFNPLRQRIQSGVDRRFYRQKYDADLTVDRFAEQIRDEAVLDVLEAGLVSVVAETTNPEEASLWLPDVAGPRSESHRALSSHYLDDPNQPVETVPKELGAQAPRLRDEGVEVVIPLVSHGELVGVLELGPCLGDRTYSGLDLQLLARLARTAAPALRFAQLVAQREAEAQERERVAQELRIARSIQRDLLPTELPALEGWELGAHYEPAREVGGDLYDFIELPHGRWAIVVADVTDKGVPAAMVMATCRSVLRGVAGGPEDAGPGSVLQRTNELLIPDIPETMFVTCFYAVIDPESGLLSYANAGHNLPLLTSGNEVQEVRATGMPLGLMPGSEYEEAELTIDPGAGLLLYSDGLIEARDTSGDMFGKPRLIDLVNTHPGGPELIDLLLESLAAFSAGTEGLDDDVTLVTVRRGTNTGETGGDLRVLDEFTIASEQGRERSAADRVAASLEDLGLEARRMDRLKTAVAEATLNAIEHGNQNRPELPVHILVEASADRISVSVTDRGEHLELPDMEKPDLEAKLAGEDSPRGWGLFLIRNMVDELHTTTEHAYNTVQLVVYLTDGEETSEV